MIIEQIRLHPFGHFQDKTIDFVPGINVLSGLNEAGKTTVVDALLMSIYGTTPKSELYRRYEPLQEQEYRTTLLVREGQTRYRVERDFRHPRNSALYRQEGEGWAEIKDFTVLPKGIGLSDLELVRSTLCIAASDVVIDGRGETAVVKAIGARAAGNGDVTAQVAIKRLDERRRQLDNAERTMLMEQIRTLFAKKEELAKQEASRRMLSERLQETREELAARKQEVAILTPMVEAFDRLQAAREEFARKKEQQTKALAEWEELQQKIIERDELQHALQEWSRWAPYLDPKMVRKGLELDAQLAALHDQLTEREAEIADLQGKIKRKKEEIRSLTYELHGFDPSLFNSKRMIEIKGVAQALAKGEEELTKAQEALQACKTSKWVWALFAVGGGLLALAAFHFAQLVTFRWAAAVGLLIMLTAFLFSQKNRQQRKEAKRRVTEAERRKTWMMNELLGLTKGMEMTELEEKWTRHQELSDRLARLIAEQKALEERLTLLQNRSEIEQQLRQIAAAREEILTAAGCESMSQLEEKVNRWRELTNRLAETDRLLKAMLRGRTVEEVGKGVREISRQAFNAELDLQEATLVAGTLDPQEIFTYRRKLAEIDLQDLEHKVVEYSAKLEQLAATASSLDGWEVDNELSRLNAAKAALENKVAALRLAIAVVEESLKEVQENLIPRINGRAGELFSLLTGGHYTSLRVEFTTKELSLHMIDDREQDRPELQASSGTLDQAYFSLRVALAEALAGRDDFPLFLDDPFLTFDPVRRQKAFGVLKELGKRHQILYVTKDIASIPPDLLGESLHTIRL